jgi:hypothetical protein
MKFSHARFRRSARRRRSAVTEHGSGSGRTEMMHVETELWAMQGAPCMSSGVQGHAATGLRALTTSVYEHIGYTVPMRVHARRPEIAEAAYKR